jgi:hypothetical protein
MSWKLMVTAVSVRRVGGGFQTRHYLAWTVMARGDEVYISIRGEATTLLGYETERKMS